MLCAVATMPTTGSIDPPAEHEIGDTEPVAAELANIGAYQNPLLMPNTNCIDPALSPSPRAKVAVWPKRPT
jgi:hypothetical protein